MSRAMLQAWEITLRNRGNECAVIQAVDGASATFSDLDARASDWLETQVTDLTQLKGRAVVFAAENSIAWLVVFLGLLKAGAIVVPLDASEPPLAQKRLAAAIRAGFWWDGSKLKALTAAKRYRDPELCLIKVTSGSTGKPRALVFTANQLLADGLQVTSTMGIGSRDTNYALIPLGHSYGLGNLTVPLFGQGVPLICGTAALPHAIAVDFARWKPSVFPGVPAMWRALAASDLTLPGLRLCISAGAPLPAEVAQDFSTRFGLRLHNFYGSSETGGIAYDRNGAASLAGDVGYAMRGVMLSGLSGSRLRVSSAAVLTHNNPRRVGHLGAWIMPDRVSLSARGDVKLLGRRGKTVKIAGRRVNLSEVSDRLRQIPGVSDVWVGVSRGTDPVLGAVVASKQGVAELRTALGSDTAPWKIPKRLIVVAALPTTARGKPDLKALQALAFQVAAPLRRGSDGTESRSATPVPFSPS